MKLIFTSLIIWSSSLAWAQVQVAFFESRDQQGQLIELEPMGRFSHLAISVGDQWLHAHPYRGVELVDSIQAIGEPVLILSNSHISALKLSDIKQYLGQKYDFTLSWSNPLQTYCSKLVAQILDIPPTPMSFLGSVWKGMAYLPINQPGISPDEIYHELLQRGFAPQSQSQFWSRGLQCKTVFSK